MSVLTLVRHGQASYMSADYDKLSLAGEEQSARLGRYWAKHGITFDRVYSGPSKRHRHTAAIAGEIVRAAGLAFPEPEIVPDFDEFDAFTMMRLMTPRLVEQDPAVRELNEDFEASRSTPEAGRKLQKLFEEVARHWATGTHVLDSGESWVQFRTRVSRAVDAIRVSAPPSTSSVVFTSGGPISAAIGHVLSLDHAKTIEFVWLSRNCSYAQFLFSGDRFSLHAFNAIPHLDDMKLLTYR
ncbi:MAG TPA: histidine phosphatase family protein [Bryobacteraceae bacterium]|nr:histidine phosphatase family protein [Bryobacteraceae bacterium]